MIKNLPPAEQVLMENKINMAKDRLAGEEKAITQFKKFQPIVNKWAPTKPFDTLVLAMIWLLVTSILKGMLLVLSAILVARVAGGTVMDMRRVYYRKAHRTGSKENRPFGRIQHDDASVAQHVDGQWWPEDVLRKMPGGTAKDGRLPDRCRINFGSTAAAVADRGASRRVNHSQCIPAHETFDAIRNGGNV